MTDVQNMQQHMPQIAGKSNKTKKEAIDQKMEEEIVHEQATQMDIPTELPAEIPLESDLSSTPSISQISIEKQEIDDVANKRRANLAKAREALAEKRRVAKNLPQPDILTDYVQKLDKKLDSIQERFNDFIRFIPPERNDSTVADITVSKPKVVLDDHPISNNVIMEQVDQQHIIKRHKSEPTISNHLSSGMKALQFSDQNMVKRLLQDASAGSKPKTSEVSFVLF
jgi:hypothetical protein